MNRRVHAAAATLTDAQRREDRGAFWRSIHGTLAHIRWADRIWLSRFGVGERPAAAIADSATWAPDWAALCAMRARRTRRSSAGRSVWARPVWRAICAGRARRWGVRWSRRALCVAHLFNHQTHHRGQVHALLTAFGAALGDTDLPFAPLDPV